MADFYKREDLDYALTKLLKSPYANDPAQFNCGIRDALKLVRDMINGNVPDGLRVPSYDVRENVQGEWIERERHEHYPSGRPYIDLVCPFCGRTDHNGDGKFCGYCGAALY